MKSVGGGLGDSRRGRGRSGTGPRATVRLAVLLKGLALLQGMAAILEELGIVLGLATDSEVTSVIVIIWLRSV